MKKTALLIVGIVLAVVAIAIVVESQRERVVDWSETYNEKSSKPYGTSIFYKELPKLFKGQTIKTMYYTPFTYFEANSENGYGDHVAAGNYLLVGNSEILDRSDINALLNFTAKGNTIFLSDHQFPKILLDTLQLQTAFRKNNDSTATLHFTAPQLNHKAITLDKADSSAYFTNLDVEAFKILGYGNDNSNEVNFVETSFGQGNIQVHLEPKVFTNYHLLTDDRYKYVEGLLSYLPGATVYFDSYTKHTDAAYGNTNKKSDLNWLLQQPGLKWAWYLALGFILLFILFNAKRRQRVIPIVKPLENTTVDFVKTIANLYYETQDHKNLVDKKITYFLEKIRTDYHLDTTHLNAEFVEKLSQKSGKKSDTVAKTINFMILLRTQEQISEVHLLQLNTYIEEFYT